MKASSSFGSIRSEGGLLPVDLLLRVSTVDTKLPGLSPAGYHLVEGERLNEAINRSWNRLVGAWSGFREALVNVPADERTATSVTRSRWLLVLFQELGYGQLQPSKSMEVDGKTYAISHSWGSVPIHLVGARVDLDRRSEGVVGAATMSPHGLVQEYLNRSDDHLWGFVSNGLRLRLLRDNAALTRQAYVEFDLQSMFDGQEYADFAVLWLLCHQSRVEGEQAAVCVLEQWSAEAAKQGVRALDQLQGGVKAAIEALGSGFLAHPTNVALRDDLKSGALDRQEYYRQLLRLVYRLLFLFVAEDRDLLLAPDSTPEARDRYRQFYSSARIRELAQHRRGGPHGDLWAQVTVVFDGLSRSTGMPAIGLPALGSFLWSRFATPTLDRSAIANRQLLEAVLALTSVAEGKVRRTVDYRNLGSEELGSIYESLLEMHPNLSVETKQFKLTTAAGNERKTTGSYYTPTSLITELLDSALDPVLAEAAAQPDAERAILDLKVLDPACGSGHFLIAAAHRIAKRLASVRTGDDEPSPEATRRALRDVVGHCLHGIDLNPMAVELCKVSLWMEAMEPGKPLSFLEHRIVRGNALLGATPALLEAGVPDEAFKALTGDEKTFVSALKRRNRAALWGQTELDFGGAAVDVSDLAKAVAAIDAGDDTSMDGIEAKARRWSALVDSADYQAAVHAADTWCAAFVAPKRAGSPGITHGEFRTALTAPDRVDTDVRHSVDAMAEQYGFLHWHLAFLDVYDGRGGFDVVLGNPPWEKVKLSEKEFFAERAPEIAELAGARRKAAIVKLQSDDPPLWAAYEAALRQADGESHLIRSSGRFPLCGRGDVNTYAVFAEVMRDAVNAMGRLGVIVPTGIATDDTTKFFFADCVDSRRLVSLVGFYDRKQLFVGADVHGFCLLTIGGARVACDAAEFVWYARTVADCHDPQARFTLTADEIALINPNTKTAPVFRSRRDAEITKAIYRRVAVLVRDGDPNGNPWGIGFSTMFHMTNDSHRFRTAEELEAEGAKLEGNVWHRGSQRWLPLYEAKMVHHFNHRFGDYALKADDSDGSALPDPPLASLQNPNYVVQPRYWVAAADVHSAMRSPGDTWLLGFRNVCRSTDERTLISAAFPSYAVGHSMPLITTTHGALLTACLYAALDSYIVDYAVRQKLGGTNLTFGYFKQIPVLAPGTFDDQRLEVGTTVGAWVAARVAELTSTTWDLRSLGWEALRCPQPFLWDPGRRDLMRAELDASFFHLYGIDRDGVDYIMDSFPIVRRRDEAAHGEYRTKRLILERYDALAEAITSGVPYQTVLDPPPADPRCAHPASTRPDWL